MMMTLAFAIGLAMAPQIPGHAQWEITFAQVEAAIDLQDLSTAAPDTFEVRVMQRPWSDVGPLPFLRITRREGALGAQMFLYWKPDRMHPRTRPAGSDVVCRDGICVRPVVTEGQHEWEDVVRGLAADACGQRVPGGCVHCDHVWIKIRNDTTYREHSCNMPPPESPAGTILRFMKSAADKTRRQ